jgi:hypothetical protein
MSTIEHCRRRTGKDFKPCGHFHRRQALSAGLGSNLPQPAAIF